MNEFKIGDVVLLKSGSPKMTINDMLEDGKVECTWFDNKSILQHQVFKKELLKTFQPPGSRIRVM
jgi:uncharacterized protein YodC (DUF2158 family)